jgi:hypothetical protein
MPATGYRRLPSTFPVSVTVRAGKREWSDALPRIALQRARATRLAGLDLSAISVDPDPYVEVGSPMREAVPSTGAPTEMAGVGQRGDQVRDVADVSGEHRQDDGRPVIAARQFQHAYLIMR